MLFGPSGKWRKRQKKGEKGRFRPISGTEGQTPLSVTPPFAPALCHNFVKLVFTTRFCRHDHEAQRAFPRNNYKQPGLKQPGLGTPIANPFAPYRGQKPPKSGKRVSESSTPPFPPTPQMGISSQKNPFSLWCPV